MTHNPRKIVFTSIGVLFFVLVIVFAYGRFGRYIHGPEIKEISLEDFQNIDSNSLVIEGIVKNVQTMSINGRVLALDKDQHFSEHLVVPPGNSNVEVTVTDAFGKRRTYHYSIYSTHKDVMIPRSYQSAREQESLTSNEESTTEGIDPSTETLITDN